MISGMLSGQLGKLPRDCMKITIAPNSLIPTELDYQGIYQVSMGKMLKTQMHLEIKMDIYGLQGSLYLQHLARRGHQSREGMQEVHCKLLLQRCIYRLLPLKPKSTLWKITQYMNREAKIKVLLRQVSRRKYIIDMLIAVFSLVSIIINIAEVSNVISRYVLQCYIYTNLKYEKYTDATALIQTKIFALRMFLLIAVVTGMVLIFLSTRLQVSMLYIFERTFEEKGVYKAGLLKQMLFEMFLMCIHSPIMADFSFSISHRFYLASEPKFGTFTMDQSMVFFSLFKVYFVIRIIPHLTLLTPENSRKISDITGLDLNFIFYFNIVLIERPITFLILTLLYLVTFVGMLIHIYEKSNSSLFNPKAMLSAQFSDYPLNSQWFLITSLTSIGYGDLIPQTYFGRFIIIVACFMGTFLLSMVILTITKRTSLQQGQITAVRFRQKYEDKKALKEVATVLIQRFYRHYFKNLRKLRAEVGNNLEDHKIEVGPAVNDQSQEQPLLPDGLTAKLKSGLLSKLTGKSEVSPQQQQQPPTAPPKLTHYHIDAENDMPYQLFIKQRLLFKHTRRQLESKQSWTGTQKETLQFMNAIRSIKSEQIKDRLGAYCKGQTMTQLTDIGTSSFNQFSKVYQIQIFTGRISELITRRNIANLSDLLKDEEQERMKLQEEDKLLLEEQKRMENVQKELDREVGLALASEDTLGQADRKLEQIEASIERDPYAERKIPLLQDDQYQQLVYRDLDLYHGAGVSPFSNNNPLHEHQFARNDNLLQAQKRASKLSKKQRLLFKQQAWADRDLLIHEGGNVFIPTLQEIAEKVRRVEVEMIEIKERKAYIGEYINKHIADYQGLKPYVEQLDWELIQLQANWREELREKGVLITQGNDTKPNEDKNEFTIESNNPFHKNSSQLQDDEIDNEPYSERKPLVLRVPPPNNDLAPYEDATRVQAYKELTSKQQRALQPAVKAKEYFKKKMDIVREFEKKLAKLKEEQERARQQEEAYRKYEEELQEYYKKQKEEQITQEQVQIGEIESTSRKRKVVKKRKVKKAPKQKDLDHLEEAKLLEHFPNPQGDDIVDQTPLNQNINSDDQDLDFGWNRAQSVNTDVPSTKHSEAPVHKRTLIRVAPGMQPREPQKVNPMAEFKGDLLREFKGNKGVNEGEMARGEGNFGIRRPKDIARPNADAVKVQVAKGKQERRFGVQEFLEKMTKK
ncbi:hypothetical protein FGO68_gene2985 [Halteria grandinella]|uniref:Potassium channel domain-containing protein n=1 Tax=Halteria grandinella TaxID=5974 RepID=A0A8J8P4A6_HALGN|nr:hypothetical protein FGO68_gene2985 [Halteria grandinella]